MRIRRLKMDFSKLRPHWAPNSEFAQRENASSLIPVYVEPFLIRVMSKARSMLGPEHAALIEDIDVFIKQEVEHHHVHRDFNRMMYDGKYDRLKDFEEELSDDYKRWLLEKSLKFNCAYCEGFETLGLVKAYAYFAEYGGLLKGADKSAVDLWKWHLAEEFEHRDVCHRVYGALFGRSFLDRYFYRVYGLLFAIKHLGAWSLRTHEHLLAADREQMTPAQIAASRRRARAAKLKQLWFFLPHLLFALLPFYDPARKKTPKIMDAFLDRVEREYGTTQTSLG
jgi:predicted metal-dependent hydrolase